MSVTVDDTFEAEVRAMLARRAADIPEPADGVVPALPDGLRFSVETPLPRRGPGRRGALLAAAVIVLLLGAVGVVAVTQGDGTRERTGPADAPSVPARPTAPFPEIPGLPQGITAEDLLPIWTDPPPGEEPYAKDDGEMSNASSVVFRYLGTRLPSNDGGGARNLPIEGHPDWVEVTFAVRMVTDGPESDEATAYLWWSGESWSVMAVLSSTVTLGELVVDSDRVVGSIYGDGPVRAAALGPQVEDLRVDRWQESLDAVGENAGGDTGIAVDATLPDGPATFLVAPLPVSTDAPPAFSEIAFDPGDLAAPGPTTVPTIPDWGTSGDEVVVVGIPVDAPLAVAVEAALPEGEELDAAQHRSVPRGRMDLVELSSAVDGSGYEVTVFRAFDASEYETPWTPAPWGRFRGGGTVGQTSITAESTDGVAVRVSSVDPDGPASHEFLLALAETLTADPTVAAVAKGADPAA
jgi:hypothetical protein